MKFIHTADWHLGNKMHNIDRKKEFDSFFLWLKKEIEKEDAETLVIAGDIFDTANPSTEARTQYNRFLASLLGTCCKNIIIVGGNHDSGALLDSQKEILDALNIHVVGMIANLEPEDMVFELLNKKEEVIGICAAVPYAHEIELRKYYDLDTEKGTFGDFAYKELYKQVYEKANKLRNGRQIPIIATGHLYAANLEGRFSNDEIEMKSDDGKREIDVVGNLGSIHVETFPTEFDYVALGHIHYPTMVAKNAKVRYSGSPFVLGFDEHNIKHCVLSVEIENATDSPKVKKIEVPKTVIYKRITGNKSELQSEIESIIKNPPEKETFIELNYNWEDDFDVNEFIEKQNELLSGKNTLIIHKKHNDEQILSGKSNIIVDASDVEDLTPEEIFKELILKECKIDITNLSEEEQESKRNENLEKYLPLLMETYKEYEGGKRYAD